MNKSKEYIKNTAILLLGKFATQLISFLLIPLYTHKLATEDYGAVDLLQTYISLLVPILTLRLDSATFRFLIDCRGKKKETAKTISNILLVLFGALVFTIIISTILPFFVRINNYVPMVCNVITLMISSLFLQILRGIGDNKRYAFASVLAGSFTLIINIILISLLDYGAESILISSAIANTICGLYVFYKTKIHKYFSLKYIDKKIIKKHISYSLPMIPNSLSWWIVNVSDRTIINLFLGASFNGIYTISCKFSNLLNNIFTIFNMSWQESASLHINDHDRDEYFSKMINQLFMLFSSAALFILAMLPLVYTIVVGENYWDSYQYVPVLLYANSWNVLVNLIGGIYVAKKRTKDIAHTTIASAIINIIINVALVKYIGLHAATISTLVSYMAMAIYRAIDCQKYIKLKLKVENIIVYTLIFITSSALYLLNNPILNVINILFVVIYIILINKTNVTLVKKILARKLRKE